MAEVTLQTPVKRKDDQIKKVTLRQPSAGELRGLSLARLMQMDVSAIITVVPRISQPILDEAEAPPSAPWTSPRSRRRWSVFSSRRPTARRWRRGASRAPG